MYVVFPYLDYLKEVSRQQKSVNLHINISQCLRSIKHIYSQILVSFKAKYKTDLA